MDSPTVFVIRIWRLAQGFRASARVVDEVEACLFTSPEALLQFLCEQGAPRREPERQPRTGHRRRY
ncbi:MAG TPA: hypothetical protein VMG60_11020 [Burkholderiaceae bacterium]|nr:hypothetical protein [Burkholderiaceae bacterium]